MFIRPWSPRAVFTAVALAAVLGYCGGKYKSSSSMIPLANPIGLRLAPTNTNPASVSPEMVLAPPTLATPPVESLPDLCRRLFAQPATPDRNDAVLAALEKLAEQDPQQAIALAQKETNTKLREQLLAAAFRGWGKTDASAAANWILAQPANSLDANAAIAAVLKGAVQNPDAAVALTLQLNQKNPEQAREYGDALIYALGQNGNFQQAADFAASSGEHATEWLAAAYGNWANYQPKAAAAAALQAGDPAIRTAALDAVIPNWGQTDPQGLAEFAANQLPVGDQRTRALANALVCWAGNDVLDAANWINALGPAPELDQGEAAIATQQEVMKQPEVALRWAQVITDENLRSRTLAAVVQTWALADPSAAQNFVQTSPDILADDRAALLSQLAN